MSTYNPPPLLLLLFALAVTASCGRHRAGVDPAAHEKIVALRNEGKQLRNESRFDEALKKHGEGLQLAEQAGDTLEWVQALNNIGTDYRRMGVLDAALQYHESALQMAKECADTAFAARKNIVVSLNGLANVYLTVGNMHLADSTLRLALAGERELGSHTGMAINYANLGSIMEKRGETDSAWACYRKSMEQNKADSNTLGIALCHTYFGNLYEKARQYDKALEEYAVSYAMMKESKDDWHTLNALTALAGVYIEKGDEARASAYLDEAKAMATKIHSNEHLATIYTLYYKMRKRRGDWHGALSAHEQATALQDSVIDMEKVNRMQSISYSVERGQQLRRMAAVNDRLRSERSTRHIGYIVFGVVLVLLSGIIALLIHARRLRARSHAALKELNNVRESFFTNITHEFRTPLTVILGLSHDLRQGDVPQEEVRDVGTTISRQGTRMLHLINQLLDISKIRSAVGTPEWRNGNVVAYVEMIVETFEDYARQRGVELRLDTPERNVETDFVPDYINKVVGNLLSNALKFTPKGGLVTLGVRQKDGQLHLSVADTGRGIPADELPHIFEAFYQSSNVADSVGTGVGLTLVKQIVTTLGGTLSADSTEGKGTTIRIVLPLRHGMATAACADQPDSGEGELLSGEAVSDAANRTDATVAAGESEPQDAMPSVLVVEDNADVAAYIRSRLKGKYSAVLAKNGEQGLALAREKLPDVIITDLMMPGMDGLEMTRRLRADMLTCHIPVIVVTAKVTENDRLRGLEAGADAYLTKPFSSDELLTRVDKLLEQRRLLSLKFSQRYEVCAPKASEASGSVSTVASSMLQASGEAPKPTGVAPQLSGNTAATVGLGDASPTSKAALAHQLDVSFINRLTDSIYLMINANKAVDVNAVAERMNMSYSQFYRKLSALTGMTPVQYIQRVKVAKAKRMISQHPERSLNIVAEQCGFSDYSNFVRAFKNVLNLTPTQYLRKLS